MAKIVIANWKMHGNKELVVESLNKYITNVTTNRDSVILALPTVYLSLASDIIKEKKAKIKLAAQNVSKFVDSGAYTGEVAATMLREVGVSHVIIGHSERRMFFHENVHTLFKKINAAILAKMVPVFCIGEEIDIRESGKYQEFLLEQLALLHQVEVPISEIIISYEPRWAIGTGVTPKLSEIAEILELIYAFMQNYLPHAKITALYGGSVAGNNASAILDLPQVGGVLVGSASLNVDEFTAICSNA